MNWFKGSQQVPPIAPRPIAITFYNNRGEMGISFNGSKTYTYPNVPPPLYGKVKLLLGKKNYSAAYRILQSLKKEMF